MSKDGRGEELTVATVITKAALLEQMLMSGSTAMIFLTLVTGLCQFWRCVKWRVKLTGELSLAGDLLPGRNGCGVVGHF